MPKKDSPLECAQRSVASVGGDDGCEPFCENQNWDISCHPVFCLRYKRSNIGLLYSVYTTEARQERKSKRKRKAADQPYGTGLNGRPCESENKTPGCVLDSSVRVDRHNRPPKEKRASEMSSGERACWQGQVSLTSRWRRSPRTGTPSGSFHALLFRSLT